MAPSTTSVGLPARDDEPQIPADVASDLARASVESLHVIIGQHAIPPVRCCQSCWGTARSTRRSAGDGAR
jgi:hypothetical protein